MAFRFPPLMLYNPVMDRDDFDKAVDDALAAIPERFREKMVNVVFVVEDGHGPADGKDEDGCPYELLGLYEGIPLTERGEDMSGILPDMITLFKGSIEEEAAECDVPVARVVRETVWHEVAHFFGFDEDKAEELERKWESEEARLKTQDSSRS